MEGQQQLLINTGFACDRRNRIDELFGFLIMEHIVANLSMWSLTTLPQTAI